MYRRAICIHIYIYIYIYIYSKFDTAPVGHWQFNIDFRLTGFCLPALGLQNTTFQLWSAIWAYETRHSSFGRPFGPTKYDIPVPAGHLGLRNTTFQLRPAK